jgi:hypothetical protein
MQVGTSFIQTAVSHVIEVIPLTCLEKIIVGQCYENALNTANASYKNCPVRFKPTSNDLAEGVAATIPYKCGGNLKTVIVFGPRLVEGMYAEGTVTATGRTAQLLHHELAHAFDYEIRFRRFRTKLFAIELSSEQAFLWKLCNRLWSEYFASRWGAMLSGENSYGDDLLENAHLDFKLSLKQAIKEYPLGGLAAEDFNSLLVVKTQFLLDVLARVLGHFDAYQSDDNPNARSFRFVHSSSAVDLLPFHQVLKELWDACAKWKSVDEFLALNLPTRSLLRHHGISVKTDPSSGYYLELAD